MKTFATFAIALCVMCGVVGNARAAEVTLKLSDQEQAAMLQLLDLAAKAGGIRASGAVSYFVQKLTPPAAPGAAPAVPAVKPEEKKPEEKKAN